MKAMIAVAAALIATGFFAYAQTTPAPKTAAPAARTTTPTGPTAKATFAGGCFWCMEPPFDRLDGVVSTTSGYTGGKKAGASYEEVSAGGTGHYEAVRV